MRHRDFVAATESLAVVVSCACRNMRMTIFVAPLYVRRAVMVEVLAGSFDAVMEALTLDIAKLLRRCVPSTRSLVVIVVRAILWLSDDKARGPQSESKYWKCKSIELHVQFLRPAAQLSFR